MGLKKYKNLFTGSGKKKSSATSNTSEKNMSSPATDTNKEPKKRNVPTDQVSDKAQIEQLRKIISSKLKDPSVAKKAAQLIEEMLKNSKR